MKKHINPYIIPATGMIIVLLIAISLFYRHSEADNRAADISLEEAKSIALRDAGMTEGQVTFTKAVLDPDSGTAEYEIDFYTDTVEYDYEINASTGSILEKETRKLKTKNTAAKKDTETVKTNPDETSQKKSTKATDVIGVNKAKKIVIKASGYDEKELSFTAADLETSDGKLVYEIKFLRKGQECDYEVDAYSGQILEWDVEADDSQNERNLDDHDDDDD